MQQDLSQSTESWSIGGLATQIKAFVRSGNRLEPRLATGLVLLSIGLGLLADLLFREARLGLNFPAWIAAMVGALVLAGRLAHERPGRLRSVLLAASLLFACLAAWRAANLLQALDLAASTGLLLLSVAIASGQGVRRLSFLSFALTLLAGLTSLCLGACRLAQLMPWRSLTSGRSLGKARSVARGLLLATPLLLVFGLLFVAADAVFEAGVHGVFSLDLGRVPSHLLWVAAGSWVAAGLFWCAFGFETPDAPALELPERHRIQTLETTVVLGSLTALFAAFVGVQVRYLFGGEALVQRSIHLTYSEYARRGFFELVAVTALLLPVLLLLDWARQGTHRSQLIYRWLALSLVALLYVVMASALQRLHVYESVYGLTQLRFYPAAFLVWLGCVFALFVWSLFGERRSAFASGWAVSGALAILVLNVVSPDALIARTNTARTFEVRPFDVAHAAGLSADAVPTLVARLDRLAPAEACELSRVLLERWSNGEGDARSWSLSRERAHRSVTTNQSTLEAYCKGPS